VSQVETKGEAPLKCPKCGFENPSGIRFCGNCGQELKPAVRSKYVEALVFLQVATSLYFLISIAFNKIVQSFPFFLISYAAVGLAGIYIGAQLHRGGGGSWLKLASAISIALGLGVSSYLFILGLMVGGVVGPAWVLFIVCAWLLWVSRKSL
jgi:hypothetical protein